MACLSSSRQGGRTPGGGERGDVDGGRFDGRRRCMAQFSHDACTAQNVPASRGEKKIHEGVQRKHVSLSVPWRRRRDHLCEGKGACQMSSLADRVLSRHGVASGGKMATGEDPELAVPFGPV